MPSKTIREAIEQGLKHMPEQSESPTQDLQVLMAHVLGKEKAWVMAHTDEALTSEELERWEAALGTFQKGIPLPYVLGEWEFYGLILKVTPAVLIPRPETELLVETGLGWLTAHPGRRRALDVGTGSGCIAIALAANQPDLQVVATDSSRAALKIARANVERFHFSDRIHLVETNLLEDVAGPFDLICSNLPYIPDERLPNLEVSKWEPRVALGGGIDGLRFIEPFLRQAAAKLAPTGLALAEIDASLESAVQRLAKSNWPTSLHSGQAPTKIEVRKDLAGLPRLLVIET
jgi:release factor glutamine methyltransferase